jgi:hypothetical protein
MATFRKDGVTTIIWAGGTDGLAYAPAAQQIGYFPEIVAAGDHNLESGNNAFYAQYCCPNVWSHMVVSTTLVRYPDPGNTLCYGAYRDSGGPDTQPTGTGATAACIEYNDLRLMFTGIQVAGPRLAPRTMAQGFDAIPRVASTNPGVPACFFLSNDYTCTKDQSAEWYDSTAVDSPYATGCWRMFWSGRRYVSGSWPAGDIGGAKTASDPCNHYYPDPTAG